MQRRTTYREQSRIFLAQAHEELAKGDLPQASEKGWGAAAHMLKAVADKRGWKHDDDKDLYTVVSKLRLELVEPELTSLFSSATVLRVNVGEGWLAKQDIEDHIRQVKAFLERLAEAMPELRYEIPPAEPRSASVERSRNRFAKARDDLAKGYRADASENGWLAAAEMAKVIGEKRGWACSTVHEMIEVTKKLDREGQVSDLSGLFVSCYYNYCSFLDFDHASDFIEITLGKVEKFIDKAERLLGPTA